MKSIVFVGGTISNMISAIEMSGDYVVTVIELNAEIGLPCTAPGHIHNLDLLKTYLDSNQMEFLQPYPFTGGYTLRSEWVLKHLGSIAAHKDVNILTRTRITECFVLNDTFTVEYIGAGSKESGQIECNYPENIYSLQRHEGLTEVWQESPVWSPKRGWIETITCSLPQRIQNRTIDAQILEGRRIVSLINNSD